jgi:hypothetical protein
MIRTLRILLILALVVAAAAYAPAAHAGNFVGGDQYTLDEGESSDDNLYAFGNTVLILGTVDGDLVAAGSVVTVGPSGEVTGDVWAAGSDVRIEGTVGGDVRGAGFSVRVVGGGSVGGEVLAAGYHIGLEEGAEVGSDFTAAGYQAALDGSVGDDVVFSGSAVRLAGAVGGNVQLDVEPAEGASPMVFPGMGGMPAVPKMAGGLDIADTATIEGDLDYTVTGGGEPEVDENLVAGAVNPDYRERPSGGDNEPDESRLVSYGKGVLSHFLGLLLIGALGLWLAPRLTEMIHGNLAAAPLPATGWGCLTRILVPVAVAVLITATIFLMILLGFFPFDRTPVLWLSGFLGSALLFGSLLAVWIGRAIAGLWIGRLILGATGGSPQGRAWPLLLGCLIVAMLVELPMLGGFLGWLIGVIGLGAMVITAQKRRRSAPPTEGLAMAAA